mmetsp:Transcript_38242/g.93068  ORF Transcript_38242/g.93068 Transcript_38242/m.93068 type:complete len:214 (-) Transcript_38242:114-755(-)
MRRPNPGRTGALPTKLEKPSIWTLSLAWSAMETVWPPPVREQSLATLLPFACLFPTSNFWSTPPLSPRSQFAALSSGLLARCGTVATRCASYRILRGRWAASTFPAYQQPPQKMLGLRLSRMAAKTHRGRCRARRGHLTGRSRAPPGGRVGRRHPVSWRWLMVLAASLDRVRQSWTGEAIRLRRTGGGKWRQQRVLRRRLRPLERKWMKQQKR